MLEIIPSIDLRNGKVVRLKQGDYAQQLNYDVDPLNVARSFADAGASWIHIVDLDGAKEGRPMQTDLIKRIIDETGLKAQVGGGIRDRLHVEELLVARARRIVIGTKALEDWEWFEDLVDYTPMDRKLVLALDAKNGYVATRGWTETTGKLATEVAATVSDWPLAAILYTDVAKDGMMQGPNLEQTRAMALAGKVPVIASGGVGTIEHIRQLTTIGVWGAIVGRSLYEGTVNLRDAIEAAQTPD